MKLVRYGALGREKPGIIGASGEIRDLSGVVPDIVGDVLSDSGLDALRAAEIASLPVVEGAPRLGAPIGHVAKFIGVGLNYADHAAETNSRIPREPVLFTKATSCISGPNDDIVLPPGSEKGDWEVELAVVIGRRAKNIAEAEAIEHVAGYCTCNDVSERFFQVEGTGQWLKGKSADTFGPLGPWLVTRDEIPDPQALELGLDLNGEQAQRSSTSNMVYSVPYLVAFISKFMTLLPGDVIATGTPPGVGMGRKPPRFLKAGDELRLWVEGLGEQRQRVVAS